MIFHYHKQCGISLCRGDMDNAESLPVHHTNFDSPKLNWNHVLWTLNASQQVYWCDTKENQPFSLVTGIDYVIMIQYRLTFIKMPKNKGCDDIDEKKIVIALKHFKLQPTFFITPQNCHEHHNIMWQIGHILSHIHSLPSVGYSWGVHKYHAFPYQC